jgi:hypothetical protein
MSKMSIQIVDNHTIWLKNIHKSYNSLLDEQSIRSENSDSIVDDCKKIWLDEMKMPPLIHKDIDMGLKKCSSS